MHNFDSGVAIILPTRDAQRNIEHALGPVLGDLKRVDIDVYVLIEYVLDQWIVAEIDQELMEQAQMVPEHLITQYAVWDFIVQNERLQQNVTVQAEGVDRTPLVAAVKCVCAYVFEEIVPMIKTLGLSDPALRNLTVVRWLGQDLVVGVGQRYRR